MIKERRSKILGIRLLADIFITKSVQDNQNIFESTRTRKSLSPKSRSHILHRSLNLIEDKIIFWELRCGGQGGRRMEVGVKEVRRHIKRQLEFLFLLGKDKKSW